MGGGLLDLLHALVFLPSGVHISHILTAVVLVLAAWYYLQRRRSAGMGSNAGSTNVEGTQRIRKRDRLRRWVGKVGVRLGQRLGLKNERSRRGRLFRATRRLLGNLHGPFHPGRESLVPQVERERKRERERTAQSYIHTTSSNHAYPSTHAYPPTSIHSQIHVLYDNQRIPRPRYWRNHKSLDMISSSSCR